MLGARDTSSFAVREQLQLREGQLKGRDAEVQALQQKLSSQGSLMAALEGACGWWRGATGPMPADDACR